MYRILVFSDSHGKTEYMTEAMEKIIDTDLVVHLGDNVRDIETVSYIYPDFKYAYVCGNCDISADAPYKKIIEADGFRILLTHGHEFHVKSSLLTLTEYAKENNIDCVLYGHTHLPYCSHENGILFLNPGSGSITGNESYGVVEIYDGKIKGCIIKE